MKTNQLYSRYTASVAFIALLIGIGLGMMFHKETVIVRQGTPDTPAALSSVGLMIDGGDGNVHTWNTISWHESMSVLGLLEFVASTKNITLLSKQGADGNAIPDSINGIANDPATHMRWQFWVNNTYEPRTASKYYLKPGDLVVFKYVKEQLSQ